jgi:hypothetical protein
LNTSDKLWRRDSAAPFFLLFEKEKPRLPFPKPRNDPRICAETGFRNRAAIALARHGAAIF